MRLFRQPPAQSLSEWLDLATQDLVPSAQARIRTEIEAHYNEAVQTRLVNGSPDDAAQATALADLGSAKSAARRFRREYLTAKESQKAAQLMLSVKRGGSWLHLYLWLNIMAPVYLSDSYNPGALRYRFCEAINLLVIPIGLAGSIAIYFLAKQNITIRSRRQIILLTCIMWLFAGPLFLGQYIALLPTAPHAPADTVFNIFVPVASAIMFAGSAYVSLGLLRLRQKLLSASEADIPPPDPRAQWPVGPWRQ